MNRPFIIFCTGVIMQLACIAPALAGVQPVELKKSIHKIEIGHSHLGYLALDSENINTDTLLSAPLPFNTLPSSYVNFGIVRSNFLFHCSFINTDTATERFFLELTNPRIGEFEIIFFIRDSLSYRIKQGDYLPFTARPVLYNYFAYPLIIPAHTPCDLFIFIKHKGHNLNNLKFNLFTERAFFDHTTSQYLLMGFALGISLIVTVLGVFFLVNSRERVYFFYSVYVILSVLWLLARNGYGMQYLWGDHPWWNTSAGPSLIGFSIFCLAETHIRVFKRNIGNMPFYKPIRFLQYLSLAGGFAPLLPFIEQTNSVMVRGYLYSILLLYFLLILLIFTAHIITIKKQPSLLRFFTAAVTLKMITTLYAIVADFLLSDSIINIEYLLMGSLLIEIILLIFGLTREFYLYKRENIGLRAELLIQQVHFSQELLAIQEIERKRIAEDLHDELGGNLAAIKMTLQSFRLPHGQSDSLVTLIDQASENARNISHNLMPPEFEQTSLHSLLDHYYRHLNIDSSLRFHFHSSGNDHHFDKQDELTIYRILMELTNNIIRHAQATEATIQVIYYEKYLELMAEDNGIGFHKKNNSGIGLKNINSRVRYLNGTLYIDSGKQGTTIMIRIPFKNT